MAEESVDGSQESGEARLPEMQEPAERLQPRRAAIVSAVAEGDRVALTVRVREDDGEDHEYTGSLPMNVLLRLEPAEQRRALVEAVRLERDRVKRAMLIDLAALTGEVELW